MERIPGDYPTLTTHAGHLVQLVPRPTTALDETVAALLASDCLKVARAGFGTDAVTETDVRLHALDVEYGTYIFADGHCCGFASLEVVQSVHGLIAYMAGTVIDPSLHGTGGYGGLIILRLLLAEELKAQWWGTRTQSPRVAQAYSHYDAYPFVHRDEATHRDVAGELARVLYEAKSDYQRPGGLAFDSSVGVMREAYAHPMYPEIPACSDANVAQFFNDHLQMERGDAAILVGKMRRAADHEDRWSRSFDSTTVEGLQFIVESLGC